MQKAQRQSERQRIGAGQAGAANQHIDMMMLARKSKDRAREAR